MNNITISSNSISPGALKPAAAETACLPPLDRILTFSALRKVWDILDHPLVRPSSSVHAATWVLRHRALQLLRLKLAAQQTPPNPSTHCLSGGGALRETLLHAWAQLDAADPPPTN